MLNTYQTFQSGPRKGQPKTAQDIVVRFLTEGLGRKEVESKSRYRKFISENPERMPFFVGKNGAVRAGRSASDSISLTDQVHANMKLWEQKKGEMK